MILPTPSGVEHIIPVVLAVVLGIVMILPTPSGVEHQTAMEKAIAEGA